MARCWPDKNVKFFDSGEPDCAPNAIDPGEGRKSFPSGELAVAAPLCYMMTPALQKITAPAYCVFAGASWLARGINSHRRGPDP